MTGRRLLILLVVLAAIAIPAGVLQAVCAGRSCDEAIGQAPRVPFCPLPAALREELVNGYREGRSPDVLGVAADTPVFTEIDGAPFGWPALGSTADTRVPMVFWGAGVAPGAIVPDGATLDRIAPTVSQAIALQRRFPDVRSGTAIEGVAESHDHAKLVLLIAWKGIGTSELESSPADWPYLSSLFANGAGTLEAETDSLPLDPAATLTTIGTGGLPSQHGITGSLVRNDEGELVSAFGEGSPVQVIATMADDLEESSEGRALVGLVAAEEGDRGLVGGGWYPDEDPVDVVIGDRAEVPRSVDALLASGYGADDVVDVIGVAMDGSIRSLDARTRTIVADARHATRGSVLVVVAGAGSHEAEPTAVSDESLVDAVEEAVPGDSPAVAATVPGGIFLDQTTLTEAGVTGQVAVDALLGVTDPNGREMMADAFQGFAVSFARYC